MRRDIEIQVFPNLPHGFLNMGLVSTVDREYIVIVILCAIKVVPEALEAIRLVSKWMAIHLQVEWCGNT